MSADLTFAAIFLAGLISFVSPCVLPLVPPYLTYLAGVSLEELQTNKTASLRGRVMTNALAFVLGFSVVFIALGAGASSIGSLMRQYQGPLSIIAGLIIIVMGLHFLGLFRIPLLYREARFQVSAEQRSASIGGAFLMGLAFAFGWTPCIGPVLGAILSVAGTRASVGEGAGMLALYAAGLGVPFLLAALFAEPFGRFLVRFRRHLGIVEKVMGALLVLTGIAFLTGWMQAFAFFLLETFPAFQYIG